MAYSLYKWRHTWRFNLENIYTNLATNKQEQVGNKKNHYQNFRDFTLKPYAKKNFIKILRVKKMLLPFVTTDINCPTSISIRKLQSMAYYRKCSIDKKKCLSNTSAE